VNITTAYSITINKCSLKDGLANGTISKETFLASCEKIFDAAVSADDLKDHPNYLQYPFKVFVEGDSI
jgi:hypothetical protein